MISFLDSTPQRPDHSFVRGLLATASVRLREANDWLQKQEEADDRYLAEDYHHLARRDALDAAELTQQAVFILKR